jgi:hypothetical protein
MWGRIEIGGQDQRSMSSHRRDINKTREMSNAHISYEGFGLVSDIVAMIGTM